MAPKPTRYALRAALTATMAMILVPALHAQDGQSSPLASTGTTAPAAPPFGATYADLADLADAAPLIIRVQLRKIVPVAQPARARAGTGRFYIEGQTIALIARKTPSDPVLGATVAFLADLPLDARGRAPALRKRETILFAREARARPAAPPDARSDAPSELTLVAPDAMLLWDANIDARLRAIVTALLAPDTPARITGVRELVNTPGDLAGASETQVFLTTADGSAASLSIEHAAGSQAGGQPARWGASFSELVAAGSPPARDTLPWYRLACFLPRTPPADATHPDIPEASAQAADDYRFVIAALGPCPRLRR